MARMLYRIRSPGRGASAMLVTALLYEALAHAHEHTHTHSDTPRRAAADSIELTDFTLMSSEDVARAAAAAGLSALISLSAQGALLSTPRASASLHTALRRGTGAGIAAAVYKATVPCTVLACLIDDNGMFPDVFYSANLANINASMFDVPWWYTTQFTVAPGVHAAASAGARGASWMHVLRLRGIGYRADVWFDGQLIASNSDVVGTFRYFDLALPSLAVNSSHALALLVYRAHDRALPPGNNDTDLALSFIDWAPPPPDSSMGLWRGVEVMRNLGVSLDAPGVDAKLRFKDQWQHAASGRLSPSQVQASATAELTVCVWARNWLPAPVNVNVTAVIRSPNSTNVVAVVQKIVQFAPNVEQQVVFDANDFPQLVLNQPPLWWPWQMGEAALHGLTVTARIQGDAVDTGTVDASFGIRETGTRFTSSGQRMFTVNSLPILIRGAGWSPDLFLRRNPQSVEAQLRYTKDMGLNTIRLEGKFEEDIFFDLADRLGLLVMPGFACCDAWQHWAAWGPAQYTIAAESLRTQVRRLRVHPSVLAFFLSSDELAPTDVEAMYLQVLVNESWPNPSVSAASAGNSSLSGPTGVKMSGPYSWVPPSYFMLDSGQYQLGGGWGFLTEGGPGENPLLPESLMDVVPEGHLWPPAPNDCWGHCGNPQGLFGTLKRFNAPLSARYGAAVGLQDYLAKAQLAAYEGHRAMFEAYTRNKYILSTGVIQWMLNNAYPEGVWHLYEYSLLPSAAYFATKLSNEPVHIIYSYDNSSVYVVNSLYEQIPAGLVASSTVIALNSTVMVSHESTVQALPVDSASELPALQLPRPSEMRAILGTGATYFVRVQLKRGAPTPALISDNWYWLSTTEDVLLWNASTFYNTPCSSYADMTQLQLLPRASVQTSVVAQNATSTTVLVSNTASDVIAFFIRLRLAVPSGAAGRMEDVLPVFWQDNFITMMPGESRTLSATYDASSTYGFAPVVLISTFNGR